MVPPRSASSVRRGEGCQEARPRVVADLAQADAKAKENEGGGLGLETDELSHEFLRGSSLCCTSLRRQKSGGGRRLRFAVRSISRVELSVSPGPPAGRGRQALRRDVLALVWVQLKAPVVQAFFEACEEGLRGFVRTANGSIVKVERSRV